MKNFSISFVAIFFIAISALAVPPTPNPQMSPGGMCNTEDPHWEEFRYQERIPYCKRKVSSSLKRRVYEAYGIPSNCRKHYTIDHIVPLSIGGNNGPENLWPEHKSIKRTRYNLEYELYLALRDARISQQQAVETILRAKFNPVFPPNFAPSPLCPN